MDLDTVILWCIYIGALEGRKRREYRELCATKRWKLDLAKVQLHLAAEGLVL